MRTPPEIGPPVRETQKHGRKNHFTTLRVAPVRSLRLRFAHGTVRAVSVFGSDCSFVKRVSVRFCTVWGDGTVPAPVKKIWFLTSCSDGSGSDFGSWKNGFDDSGKILSGFPFWFRSCAILHIVHVQKLRSAHQKGHAKHSTLRRALVHHSAKCSGLRREAGFWKGLVGGASEKALLEGAFRR